MKANTLISQVNDTITQRLNITDKLLSNFNQLKNGYIQISGVTEQSLGEANSDLRCHIAIHDEKTFALILQQGVLGAAEAYLQGLWDVDELVVLIRILVRNRNSLDKLNDNAIAKISQIFMRAWYWRNRNNKFGSKKNIAAHYDLSNDFFKLFLDKNMMYSSAFYQQGDETLEQASDAKLDKICQRLALKPTDHIVEIGSGWGGFAIFAAENYGCQVTTTTISNEQYLEAEQRILAAGLENKITLLKKDYRDLNGKFDKLVSIEMIEAVGHQYLDTYFQQCQQLLKPNGLGLIQAITIEDTRYAKALKTVDYIKRYVFPGSFIPCNSLMIDTAARQGLKLKNLEDIGQSYALTLNHWRERFHNNIEAVKNLGFDERFIRLWDFYLCYCEGGFIEGAISDVHLLFENSMSHQ